MQSDKKELVSHPLAKKVLDNHSPLIFKREDVIKRGKVRSDEKNELRECEWYHYDVFMNLLAIISGVGRLEKSQIFIRTFPLPRSYEKKGINQHTWIEYHYSHYVITLVSLFDIALRLTNSVFSIGNRERDCKPDLIMKNFWVKQTPVEQALADFDKLIKPHKDGRNLYVHRGKVLDIASVMKSDYLDRLKDLSSIQMLGFSEPFIGRENIDSEYKGHVKKICEKLQEERGNINDVIWRLFDTILPIYDEKSTALDEKRLRIFKKEYERRMRQKK